MAEDLVAEYAFPYAVKQMATSGTTATGATNPGWTTLAFPTLEYSFDDEAIISMPTTSQFLVKYSGIYLIHYDILAVGGGNNVGWHCRATVNTVEIPQSLSICVARASAAECRACTLSFLVQLNAGDIIEIQAGCRENAEVTVQSGSSAAIEVRRLL